MPDILIRGMRKPTSCDDCPMYTCMHNFDDCPLVELPAHGDLIDADALKAKAEYDRKHLEITGYERELLWHYLDVSMAPVIVPASEEVES